MIDKFWHECCVRRKNNTWSNEIGDVCVDILDVSAKFLGISYELINILIFIIIYPLLVLFLFWIIYLQRNKILILEDKVN